MSSKSLTKGREEDGCGSRAAKDIKTQGQKIYGTTTVHSHRKSPINRTLFYKYISI